MSKKTKFKSIMGFHIDDDFTNSDGNDKFRSFLDNLDQEISDKSYEVPDEKITNSINIKEEFGINSCETYEYIKFSPLRVETYIIYDNIDSFIKTGTKFVLSNNFGGSHVIDMEKLPNSIIYNNEEFDLDQCINDLRLIIIAGMYPDFIITKQQFEEKFGIGNGKYKIDKDIYLHFIRSDEYGDLVALKHISIEFDESLSIIKDRIAKMTRSDQIRIIKTIYNYFSNERETGFDFNGCDLNKYFISYVSDKDCGTFTWYNTRLAYLNFIGNTEHIFDISNINSVSFNNIVTKISLYEAKLRLSSIILGIHNSEDDENYDDNPEGIFSNEVTEVFNKYSTEEPTDEMDQDDDEDELDYEEDSEESAEDSFLSATIGTIEKNHPVSSPKEEIDDASEDGFELPLITPMHKE